MEKKTLLNQIKSIVKKNETRVKRKFNICLPENWLFTRPTTT